MSRPASALVVEDDRPLLEMLRRHLGRAGFIVYEAASERDAIRKAQETSPDVVVLDLALTEGSGGAVCEWLRSQPTLADVPVLVLSARDDVATKVGLLTMGADDYVVKPAEPAELIARLRTLLRRRDAGPTLRRVGRLRVALGTGDAWVGEVPLELTAGERALLSQLVRSWPAATPRAALEQVPWRTDQPAASNVTEVLIGRLRRKLEAAGSGVRILAVRRLGYALRAATEEGVAR